MGDRHQFRAKWHDYNYGIYFITICAYKKRHIFGKIIPIHSIDPVGTRLIASASAGPSPTANSASAGQPTAGSSPTPNPASAGPLTASPAFRFIPSELGKIVSEHITSIPHFHPDVELLNHVVMPNHVHFVLAIRKRNPECNSTPSSTGCLKPPKYGNPVTDNHHNSRLATILGAFKAGVTRRIRTRRIASLPVWQTRFHEHIIRNQHSFDNIMNYIDTNVENWDKDCFADSTDMSNMI